MKVSSWIRQHHVRILIGISLFFASWGVLVYDFGVLGLPWPYPSGWDEFVLGISYGIFGGVIVYTLTVEIPLCRRKSTYRKTLFVWLANTYREFSDIPKAIPSNIPIKQTQIYIPGEGMSDIIDVNWIICILEQAKDTQYIRILNSHITILEVLRYYLNKIYERAQMILNIYSDILTTKEINCLNTIITSEVYAYLKFIVPTKNYDQTNENTPISSSYNTSINVSLPIGLICEVLRCLYTCFLSLDNKKCDFSIDINQNE